ncbi:EpsI family protein [Sphingomonas fennica]|nr:EpsI family protein [Sphingomonas fennica]
MRDTDDERAAPGSGLSRRNLLLGGVMLGTAALCYARQPKPVPSLLGKTKLDSLIPNRIGRWTYETSSGLVLPPRDQLSERIYDQLVTRVYTAPDGTGVMLLVAYSGRQDGMIQVHRPEVCYPASGYALTESVEHPVRVGPQFTLPTRFIVAEGRSRIEQLIYWTRVGPSFPTGWLGQRRAVIDENLQGRIPDGVLVRISTIAQDSSAALTMLDDFTNQLLPVLPAKARQALIGRT